MRCSQARKLMSPYLDQELGGAGRERLAAHLGGCERCRGAFASLERVHALFGSAERPAAPARFTARVLAAVRAQEQRRLPRLLPVVRLAGEAAVCAAVILAGVFAGKYLTAGITPAIGGSPAAILSLDVFADAPPDSPGGVYLAMIEAYHE